MRSLFVSLAFVALIPSVAAPQEFHQDYGMLGDGRGSYELVATSLEAFIDALSAFAAAHNEFTMYAFRRDGDHVRCIVMDRMEGLPYQWEIVFVRGYDVTFQPTGDLLPHVGETTVTISDYESGCLARYFAVDDPGQVRSRMFRTASQDPAQAFTELRARFNPTQ